MPKAELVAKYLVSKSTPNTTRAITPLKLQKLLYYCQGWHMAFNQGKPLFEEDLFAWKHGPVVPEIYYSYKKYGYLTIPAESFENKDEKGKRIFSDRQLEVLNAVWEAYGKYDGKYLEELTHQEEPWSITKQSVEIQKTNVFKYFSKLLSKK
ncbi:Panacea domain-containing protein [Planococcus koreensis]|uniref:Panacea domain-containing protein n=1 Tax=Planococcus koreensis TaxID=112331 RepID=UPI0039FC9F3F